MDRDYVGKVNELPLPIKPPKLNMLFKSTATHTFKLCIIKYIKFLHTFKREFFHIESKIISYIKHRH